MKKKVFKTLAQVKEHFGLPRKTEEEKLLDQLKDSRITESEYYVQLGALMARKAMAKIRGVV
jgi:hypothetical protein